MSSETIKYAVGITAGIFQKHLLLEYPNKLQSVIALVTCSTPPCPSSLILQLEPSDIREISSYTLQHCA